MKLGPYKKISSKKVYENPFFSVVEDELIWPDGKKGKFYVTTRYTGAVIIPFDGRHLYLVNQYRYSIKKRSWEIPAGACDTNNFLSEAKRELKEETGITAKKWTYLGRFACAPGHSDHWGRVYLAEKLSFGKHNRIGGEVDMYMKSFSIKQVEEMIVTGKIFDSWAITPLFYFKKLLEKRK